MTSPLASWLTTFHQTAFEHLTLAWAIRKARVSVSYPSNFWYFRIWVLVWVVAAAAAAAAAEGGVVGAAELHWEARSSLVRVSGPECKGLPHPGIRTTKCFRVCDLVHPWTPFFAILHKQSRPDLLKIFSVKLLCWNVGTQKVKKSHTNFDANWIG